MSKFDAKPTGQRYWLIWKSISDRKLLLKRFFTLTILFVAVTIFICILIPNKFWVESHDDLAVPFFVALLLILVMTLVITFVALLIANCLTCLYHTFNLSIHCTFAEILIGTPKITLRKKDGVETIIYDKDIKRIYFLDNKDRKNLLTVLDYKSQRAALPILFSLAEQVSLNKDQNETLPKSNEKSTMVVNLDILKIETKNGDNCIVLDVYEDATQIVAKLNNLHPIDGFDEYLR